MKYKWHIFYFFQITVLMINILGCYVFFVRRMYWLTAIFYIAVLLGFWLLWRIAKDLQD